MCGMGHRREGMSAGQRVAVKWIGYGEGVPSCPSSGNFSIF